VKCAPAEAKVFRGEQGVPIVSCERAIDQKEFSCIEIHLFKLRCARGNVTDPKVRRLNHFGSRQKYRSLHDVTQLADIPRPGVSLERTDRIRTKALDLFPVAPCEFVEKFFRQNRDIVWSLPEGR